VNLDKDRMPKIRDGDTFVKSNKLTSNQIYWLLIEQKRKANYMEKVWAQRLKGGTITKEMWSNIYLRRCHLMKDKKICMFNYKLLTNALPSPIQLNKWLQSISDLCEHCEQPDNIQHILYDCSISLYIWQRVSKAIKMNIKLKDVVVGRSSAHWNKKYIFKERDEIICYIAYYLYQFKMKCKNDKKIFDKKNTVSYIRKKLISLNEIMENVNQSFGMKKQMIQSICNEIM
jgi:hypothetical protein